VNKNTLANKNNEQGFSLIELLIVVLMIGILSVLTLMAFKGEALYMADSQAYSIMDTFNEARQRAITQHETIRVEINKTKNVIRIISENNVGDATDDKEIRRLNLENPNEVNIESAPTNIANSPTDSSPTPAITFTASLHPSSLNDQVATLRFLRNGNVVNAGSNAVGNNAVLSGATIFVWSPNVSESGSVMTTGTVIRAITLLSSTGSTKYWKCPIAQTQCLDWIP
jgi:prepilin-type N-terminal cleavage/methylation domain-containing protein